MTLDEFKKSLSAQRPPDVKETLKALWYAGKDDWESAHNIAQDINTREGSWIHAYLHRVEGDAGNAAYWYSRAHQPVSTLSLEEEWEQIVNALL